MSDLPSQVEELIEETQEQPGGIGVSGIPELTCVVTVDWPPGEDREKHRRRFSMCLGGLFGPESQSVRYAEQSLLWECGRQELAAAEAWADYYDKNVWPEEHEEYREALKSKVELLREFLCREEVEVLRKLGNNLGILEGS